MAYLAKRTTQILSGQDTSEPFARLSAADRQAIFEILQDTKPALLSPP